MVLEFKKVTGNQPINQDYEYARGTARVKERENESTVKSLLRPLVYNKNVRRTADKFR